MLINTLKLPIEVITGYNGNDDQLAMRRLARAVYGHDNSQALTVAAALASIYNGDCARPVQLDEIRWLDWSLQVDLVTLMLGTGHSGFEDVKIAEAFRELAGQDGVSVEAGRNWWQQMRGLAGQAINQSDQIAGQVTVLHEGRVLAEGDMDRVQNDPQVIEVYLGA